ncbi:MAG: hypothetical protein HXY40_11095 [Chloroflexi bacterium]|nr:hypothetical protein [Chloroflexota bacterium]
MRKIVFALLLLCLLAAPAAFAQEATPQPLWELTQDVEIAALGVHFNAPAGWAVESFSGFTVVAATAEAAQEYADGQSVSDFALGIAGIPLQEMTDDPDTPLDEIFATTTVGLEVTESGETTVNLRPALYAVGVGNGQGALVAIWKQDGFLMVFGMAVPAPEADVDMAFSYGMILGTVRPLVSDEITPAEERYEVIDLGFDLFYPAGWTAADAAEVLGVPGVMFYESAEDVGAPTPTDSAIAILNVESSLEDLGLEDDATMEDIANVIAGLFQVTEPELDDEFVVNGAPGIGFNGSANPTRVGFVIVTYDRENEVVGIYTLSTADEETLALYRPAFLAMLWSIRPLEG